MDPWPLDKGPRPKSGKSRLNLHCNDFEGKINWFKLFLKAQKENSRFEEPRCKLRFKARSNSKVQFVSNESKFVRILSYPKALGDIFSGCGGHHISMNFPLKDWDGYYAYSSKVGRKLCLLIGVRTLPLLNNRHENLPFIHLAFYVSLVHDKV